jgi:hypothetical protein
MYRHYSFPFHHGVLCVEGRDWNTYMVPAGHDDELLSLGAIGLHRGELEAVAAHLWDAAHAQQPVELLHTQRLPFLAARRTFQGKLSSVNDIGGLGNYHHHYQPINVHTAGAQAFFMDFPQGDRAITTARTKCGVVGANDYKCSQDQRLNVPFEARIIKELKIISFLSPIR